MRKTTFNRDKYEAEKIRIVEAGRGCIYRPVDRARYEENYDRIFKQTTRKESAT